MMRRPSSSAVTGTGAEDERCHHLEQKLYHRQQQQVVTAKLSHSEDTANKGQRSSVELIVAHNHCGGPPIVQQEGGQQQNTANQAQTLTQKKKKKKKKIAKQVGVCWWRQIKPMLSLLKHWLPILKLLMLTQSPILETNCDLLDSNGGFTHGSPGQHYPQMTTFDVMPEIEDQLNVQLSQQKSFDYLVNQNQMMAGNSRQQLAGFQQQQQQADDFIQQQQSEDPFSVPEMERSPNSQLQLVEDLLDAQSSVAAAANTASNPSSSASSSTSGSTSQQQETGTSSTGSKSMQSGGSSSSSGSTSGGLLSEQLSAVTNLLQQIGSSAHSSLSAAAEQADNNAALAESVVTGLLGPTRGGQQPATGSSSTGTGIRGNIRVRGNTNSQQQSAQQTGRPAQVVGQGIDGGLEYDSNNNQINGFFEFPSLPGLGNFSSKPSISYVKPFVLAALKTVPIKLGAVGWKLLQLIAWKKIYKTHHPKSGEIIFEQEMKQTSSSGKDHKSGGGGGSGKFGKSFDIEISKEHQPHGKTSKMGHSYPSSGGMMMGGHHPHMMHPMFGGGSMFESPMSASMMYQRHLLPPMAPGAGLSMQQQQQQHNPSAHPATAAAAAAAATAAAIQSQWVQHQLAEEMSAESGHQVRSRGSGNQTQTGTGGGGLMYKRKRASLGGNWFATPAHAYAAAAAAANAAAVAAHHHQVAGNPLNRLGLNAAGLGMGVGVPFEQAAQQVHQQAPQDGFQQALAGIMYQNLFDNAAAMAVQSAVKLPHTGSAADFLDQSDSLSGSSLSLSGAGSSSSAFNDVDSWPSEHSLAAAAARRSGLLRDHYQRSPHLENGLSDSLLALNEDSQSASALNGDSGEQPNSLMSMTDFDDTPAGQFIGAALNDSATYPTASNSNGYRSSISGYGSSATVSG